MSDSDIYYVVFFASVITAGLTLAVLAFLELRSRAISRPLRDETRLLFDGPNLLNASESGEALLGKVDVSRSNWAQLYHRLAPRFPDFPAMPPDTRDLVPLVFESCDLGAASPAAC